MSVFLRTELDSNQMHRRGVGERIPLELGSNLVQTISELRMKKNILQVEDWDEQPEGTSSLECMSS